MARQALKYGAILIGAYLILSKATNFGTVFTKGSGATVSVVKAFQGRS